jgi:integrase
MPKKKFPGYRLHKASGLAIVTLSGKDVYLGEHGTKESHARYDRAIAEWVIRGRSKAESLPSINSLTKAYSAHAEQHYLKNNSLTSAYALARRAWSKLDEMYGDTLAAEFTPVRFVAMRESWINSGMARSSVNRYAAFAKEIFRWGVEVGFVPTEILVGLRAVRGLQQGRSRARETDRIMPATMDQIEKTLSKASPSVAARIRVQLLTGMRPGEVCSIRRVDIDRSRDIWLYKPEHHKTEHKGKSRVILLGPKAQEILAKWLDGASAEKSFIFYGHGNKSRPKHPTTQYRDDIQLAARRSGVALWHPNQLRHNAATTIRKAAGIEQARIALGHSSTSMTEIYAEEDLDKIRDVMRQIG